MVPPFKEKDKKDYRKSESEQEPRMKENFIFRERGGEATIYCKDRIYAHSQIRTQIFLPDPKISPPNKPESGFG
jgi:hypothetical protein